MPIAEPGGPTERRILGYVSWQSLVAAANIVITLVQMTAEGGIGSAVVQH